MSVKQRDLSTTINSISLHQQMSRISDNDVTVSPHFIRHCRRAQVDNNHDDVADEYPFTGSVEDDERSSWGLGKEEEAMWIRTQMMPIELIRRRDRPHYPQATIPDVCIPTSKTESEEWSTSGMLNDAEETSHTAQPIAPLDQIYSKNTILEMGVDCQVTDQVTPGEIPEEDSIRRPVGTGYKIYGNYESITTSPEALPVPHNTPSKSKNRSNSLSIPTLDISTSILQPSATPTTFMARGPRPFQEENALPLPRAPVNFDLPEFERTAPLAGNITRKMKSRDNVPDCSSRPREERGETVGTQGRKMPMKPRLQTVSEASCSPLRSADREDFVGPMPTTARCLGRIKYGTQVVSPLTQVDSLADMSILGGHTICDELIHVAVQCLMEENKKLNAQFGIFNSRFDRVDAMEDTLTAHLQTYMAQNQKGLRKVTKEVESIRHGLEKLNLNIEALANVNEEIYGKVDKIMLDMASETDWLSAEQLSATKDEQTLSNTSPAQHLDDDQSATLEYPHGATDLQHPNPLTFISSLATVDQSATIHPLGVHIGAFVRIKANAVVHSSVTIHERAIIGELALLKKGCTIEEGAKIKMSASVGLEATVAKGKFLEKGRVVHDGQRFEGGETAWDQDGDRFEAWMANLRSLS